MKYIKYIAALILVFVLIKNHYEGQKNLLTIYNKGLKSYIITYKKSKILNKDTYKTYFTEDIKKVVNYTVNEFFNDRNGNNKSIELISVKHRHSGINLYDSNQIKLLNSHSLELPKDQIKDSIHAYIQNETIELSFKNILFSLKTRDDL